MPTCLLLSLLLLLFKLGAHVMAFVLSRSGSLVIIGSFHMILVPLDFQKLSLHSHANRQ